MTSDLRPPRLHARTVAVAELGPLAALLPATEAVAWLRDGEGMIGVGELIRHKASDLLDAERWWADLLGSAVASSDLGGPVPGSGPVAFGAFVFDPDTTAASSVLVVPRLVVGRRDGHCWVTSMGFGSARPPRLPEPAAVPEAPGEVRFAEELPTAAWEAAVAEAVRRIGMAEDPEGLAKIVLARGVTATTDRPVDPRRLVSVLTAGYPRCWTYLVDGLVGATPEMLLRRVDGLATSRVLAGTIRRTSDGRQDLALAAALAQSGKDLEEHEYAVASVARALAPHCSGMNVPDAPYVLQLPNVLHLATDVTAVAHPGASSLALAAALHPSAAVCGTPTELARTTIAELERLDRGRYAGPVGWIDAAGDGEWAIALRGGQLDPDDPCRLRLFAGCGVVAGSDPAAELAESEAKLMPMRTALTSSHSCARWWS